MVPLAGMQQQYAERRYQPREDHRSQQMRHGTPAPFRQQVTARQPYQDHRRKVRQAAERHDPLHAAANRRAPFKAALRCHGNVRAEVARRRVQRVGHEWLAQQRPPVLEQQRHYAMRPQLQAAIRGLHPLDVDRGDDHARKATVGAVDPATEREDPTTAGAATNLRADLQRPGPGGRGGARRTAGPQRRSRTWRRRQGRSASAPWRRGRRSPRSLPGPDPRCARRRSAAAERAWQGRCPRPRSAPASRAIPRLRPSRVPRACSASEYAKSVACRCAATIATARSCQLRSRSRPISAMQTPTSAQPAKPSRPRAPPMLRSVPDEIRRSTRGGCRIIGAERSVDG